MTDIDAIRSILTALDGRPLDRRPALAARLAETVPALLAEVDRLKGELKRAREALAEDGDLIDQTAAARDWFRRQRDNERAAANALRAELAEVRNQAHRDATDHQQDIRDRYEQIARLERHIAGLETQCNEQMHALTAERDATREVVEAAKVWRNDTGNYAHYDDERDLVATVDALAKPTHWASTYGGCEDGCPVCKTEKPKTWAAPAEPADVTAVHDRHGRTWLCPGRPGNNLWWVGQLGAGIGHEWHELLHLYGPLTAATDDLTAVAR